MKKHLFNINSLNQKIYMQVQLLKNQLVDDIIKFSNYGRI